MIETRALSFAYGDRPALSGVTLSIAAGERCLLVGRNGAGKSTLLSLLAGQHMLPKSAATILGRDAFSDTSLAREVAYVGPLFSGAVDVSVGEMLSARKGHDPQRAARLCELLEIDRSWRLNRTSAGQRRRVQLLVAFVGAPRLYLLDEVSAELDLLTRANLLAFFREESERGATVVYATHILEGLEAWASRLIWIDKGRIAKDAPLPSALLRTVEAWFRSASP